MSRTEIAPWELFPLISPSSPPLYLQRIFTTTSYTIYLTDLTSIWGETLDKSAILDRAEDRGCSIDPSTDDSQLQILLEKLAAGITGVNPAATVELEVRRDSFNITTKEKLQAPLQPLEWLFRLKLLPPAQFTKHFSLPLLYVSSLLSRQTSSLLTVIEEKDATIGRLLDKFEEYKIEITSVFPGYKKGRVPVGKAKGIAQFDKAEWSKELLSADIDSSVSKDLVKSTFRGLASKSTKIETKLPKPSDASWWTKITNKVSVKGEPELETSLQATPRKPPKAVRLNTESDDEFEALRSSPVRPRAGGALAALKHEPLVPTQPSNDDTTEDEDDDLDSVPKSQNSRSNNRSPQPTPPAAIAPSSGTLSGSIPKPSKDRASSPDTRTKTVGLHFDGYQNLGLGESTTSDSEDEPPARPPPKKSGLKKTIGGRKRREMDDEDEDEDEDGDSGRNKRPVPEPESEPDAEQAPRRVGKIKSKIGGNKSGEATKRKEPEPDSDEEMVDPEQEAPKPPPRKKEKTKSPPIEGMDEEAAQKRREELQKQLQAKAAVKKKGRRF